MEPMTRRDELVQRHGEAFVLALEDRPNALPGRSQGLRPPTGELGWYLAQVRQGQTDKQAVTRLEQFLIENYYPKLRVVKNLPKRKVARSQRRRGIEVMCEVEEAYLPRYVFVRLGLGYGWGQLFEAVGLAGISCLQGQPARISETMIAGMRAREIGGALPGSVSVEDVFHLGDRVRIDAGAFAEHAGLIQRVRLKTIDKVDIIDRLTIAVEIYGQSVSVEIDAALVTKAS